jgi:hypothetical protein
LPEKFSFWELISKSVDAGDESVRTRHPPAVQKPVSGRFPVGGFLYYSQDDGMINTH